MTATSTAPSAAQTPFMHARGAGTAPRQILYVIGQDPWDRWTNSGVSLALCSRLQAMGLLWGAWNCNNDTFAELRGRSEVRHFLRRATRRLKTAVAGKPKVKPFISPIPTRMQESRGRLGELLRRLPPDSAVLYHYVLPEFDMSLPIRRFLFQDLTLDQAAQFGGYGWARISEEERARERDFHRRCNLACDGVISFAGFVADALHDAYGVPKSKVFPVGAGAIRQFAAVAPPTRDRYARKRLLFVGRNFERKGGPVLLEAWKLVREAIPDAQLTVVSAMAQFEPGPGVEHIRFASDEDLHRLYLESSAFTMPSICETWGLVYVEAAMHGLPIVGFDTWALPDIVDDGRTGLLTSRHDALGLSEVIIRALQDPDRLHSMGTAAIARARDVLDWPHVMDRLLYAMAPEALAGREPVWMRARG